MVDPFDNLASSEQLKRLLLQEEQERLDRLEARLGDDDALKSSLSPIIADVLRDAGVKDYRRLADALAPIVLQSIKTEIHNSRDMMVDALYPITGRLVAAAVRNAFKDLVDQLNSKLDSTLSVDRWRAKIRAKLSGRSEAEILLSEGAAFEIVDLLLVNRQSGLLIAQAVADDEEDQASSHLLSSILTAIMAFVRDAMSESSEQDLRTLHVGDLRLHLQVSPTAILAVKTKGPPPAGFETALNETFYAFLSRWGSALSEPDTIESQDEVALTEDLEVRFNALIMAKQANFRRPSKKGAILLGSLALLAALWGGWSVYESWTNQRIEAKAQTVIGSQIALKGYPIDAKYNDQTKTLVISGLFPDSESLAALRQNLDQSLQHVTLSVDAGLLPDKAIDPDTMSTKAELTEVETRLSEEVQSALAETSDNLNAGMTAALAESQDMLQEVVLRTLDHRLATLSDALALIEERLPTPVEREITAFRSWLAYQTIRFDDESELNDESGALGVLGEINNRIKDLPSHIGLRVIGYSDDLGEDSVSARISRSRAALVGEMLIDLGVVLDRLQIVGRGNEKRIVDTDGTSSDNRRVEFEIFYSDEEQPSRGTLNGADNGSR